MVSLDPAYGQFSKVHVLEFLARSDSSIFSTTGIPILSIPLLANVLISLHIVQHLTVHRARKTTQHQEERETVDHRHQVPNVHDAHQLANFFFIFLVWVFRG